ncbi:MAG: hypothetical protein A3F16_05160 [Deltaproteobacteria bacterium RIFCSPHIGHO2_12_FULL_43_9]|nr:MAG: hypothetical protein A3F16_05160 [Deltaproteobacteria bacterium RIFCSPHIGHO2_12_FULL_43_9]
MKEIIAKLNLFFYFMLHFFKKPFTKRRGLTAFYEAYADDGIKPISKGDRLILQAAGRCINCGLCAQGISLLSTDAIYYFHLPSSFPLSVSRTFIHQKELPQFDGIEIGEEHCPCNVPLYSIYKYLAKGTGLL